MRPLLDELEVPLGTAPLKAEEMRDSMRTKTRGAFNRKCPPWAFGTAALSASFYPEVQYPEVLNRVPG